MVEKCSAESGAFQLKDNGQNDKVSLSLDAYCMIEAEASSRIQSTVHNVARYKRTEMITGHFSVDAYDWCDAEAVGWI